ncbi:putative esterase family protein [Gordonia araii NBRC 100433]|uniref:Putative esterase family protein n=1 Tax=Gordonia araii NBRC 100433 TaxID=1073574 RepID=G7H1F4_9ACTN|nr:alpha/beta hydrolase-fold protein [Gordonia araii]GAB09679.1 putative esterase family protein [Gordonia araii NBRC 100433]
MGGLLRRAATLAICTLIAGSAVLFGGIADARAQGRLTEITIPALPGQIPRQWLGSVLNAKHAPPYPGPPRAKVLLPSGYMPSKKYPLLILLAGASSDYRTWSKSELGRIRTTAAGFPGIIVMPEGGTGFYTDWWNGGRRNTPSWESYYLDVVIPTILKRYPIREERRWHAIAGVSMGGLGAAYLGGRLPEFFGSIATISGVTDLDVFPGFSNAAGLVSQVNARQPFDLTAVYGPFGGYYAHGHNPVRLARNLQHTRVYTATGDGTPTGDGEPNDNNVVSDFSAEVALVRPAFESYRAALRKAGVRVTSRAHAGIHDFPNFRRQLRDAIAWNLFAPVPQAPATWTNDTVAKRGQLWGFRYRFDAHPNRVVRFHRSGNTLHVSAAGTPVTITDAQGCRLRSSTPAAIDTRRIACR